ncbi:MAG: hypothetical protein U0232_19100 [Thermomicrobiales bacterium]
MEKFTKGDPDGNGKADTWGLGNQNTRALRAELLLLHARRERVAQKCRRHADEPDQGE